MVGPLARVFIHAAAELLDNATRYSPPQTKVHVTAVEVQTGVAIEIEDGGVSLSEESRARAEGMLERAKAEAFTVVKDEPLVLPSTERVSLRVAQELEGGSFRTIRLTDVVTPRST